MFLKKIEYIFIGLPRTKHDVGYRLSCSGLTVAYKKKVEFQDCIISRVVYSSGSKIVKITYTKIEDIDVRNSDGFEIFCQGSNCTDGSLWVPALISSKHGLIVTLIVPRSCIKQQLYGLRYSWHETPCPFKEVTIYNSIDLHLPSPPYIKIFE